MTSDTHPVLGVDREEVRDVVQALLVGSYLAEAGIGTQRWVLEGAALIILVAELWDLDYPNSDARARASACRFLEERALANARLVEAGRFEEIVLRVANEDALKVPAVAARLISEDCFTEDKAS
jgi:hypothetical protein